MEKPCFIKTQDEETSSILTDLGYQLLSYSSGTWTFLQNKKIDFANTIDQKKIVVSNMLYV